MFLDAATQRNLELVHNLRDGSHEGTLLWVLDETLTPMGGRMLRSSLLKPLVHLQEIKKRQDAVEYLVDDFELLEELRTSLRKIQDIERLSARVTSKTAHARDLVAIRNSIDSSENSKTLASTKNAYFQPSHRILLNFLP